MPLTLIDPPPILYYFLIFIALIGFLSFWKYQNRRTLIIFAVCLLPLLVLLGLDYSEESPREQVVRKIRGLADATRKKEDLSKGFEHVSESIMYRGHNKDSLLAAGNAAYGMYEWTGATAWDFTREEFKQESDTVASQGFMVKMANEMGVILYCRTKFQKEKDGQYRVVDFKFYNPVNRDRGSEETIPGL